MPNHYHLLLEQLQEGGITNFMHKLNTAYTNYFNKRYERTGRFFEGPFKAVLIKREGQFEHIPRYIHLNALDLTDMNWREGKIEDWHRAERFLEEYVWSSHHFYLGKPQQYPVVETSTVGEMFKTLDRYRHFLKQWSVRELTTAHSLSPFTVRA